MILLPLAWTLFTVWFWTAGAQEIVLKENIKQKPVLYPEINSNETIECECGKIPCDSVFWFRSIRNNNKLEFLAKCNNAERVNYGQVDEAHFKLSKRGGNAFTLRIISVTQADAGIYSCVVKGKDSTEMWNPGPLVLPGETPPTVPPKPKPKPQNKPVKCCSSKKQEGCSPNVLWPMVGITAGLGLALVCTLYYFSRLPKKCRHRFEKKRQTS